MIEKNNLDKTNAWPFVEAKKILRERKKTIEKKKQNYFTDWIWSKRTSTHWDFWRGCKNKYGC